jgi:cation:H+ antiporter
MIAGFPLESVGLFIISIAILLKGATVFTHRSVYIARQIGVSDFAIGLTLVAFSTSLPELAISMTASLSGSDGIAIGNIIGSNIANIGLIIGIAAIFMPLVLKKEDFKQALLMIAVLFLGSIFMYNGLSRLEGFILVSVLIAYVINALRQGKVGTAKASKGQSLSSNLFFAFAGAGAVVVGGKFVVDSSIVIARWAGISEVLIGITIIAIGTSLPELVTSIIAAKNNMPGMAIGNIIGSNIFNIAAVLGLTSLISPISVSLDVFLFDIPAMMLFSIILASFMYFGANRISKKSGMYLLTLYVIYLGVHVFFF